MKRLLTILTLFLYTISVNSQSHIFVLVDVSKSVTQNQLSDAKQTLSELLLGDPLSRMIIAQGTQQDLINFKLLQGDKVAISIFGNIQTTAAISPNPIQIQIISADINQVLNSIQWIPTDNHTYILLAKAKIAEYAKNHQIGKYKLCIITDNIHADSDNGGKPIYPDDYTKNLSEGYNTSTNEVKEGGFTKFKIPNSSSPFTLSFSPNVDISNYKLPGDSDGDGIPDASDRCPGTPSGTVVSSDGCPLITETPLLKFSPNLKRSQKEPLLLKSENVSLQWSCTPPNETRFTLKIWEPNCKSPKTVPNVTSPYNYKFSNSGLSKFSITAPNLGVSDVTWIEKQSGFEKWVIAILVIAFASGIGYYYWNKKRQEKIDVFASNKTDDIFSGGTQNSASGSSSSNSDYF